MLMRKMQIYDPPMCCSTGVCDSSVDEKLVQFSADLNWLKVQGVIVERYNISQQLDEFAVNPLVKSIPGQVVVNNMQGPVILALEEKGYITPRVMPIGICRGNYRRKNENDC